MNGAGQTLYLKLSQNSIVSGHTVCIRDVAKIECTDAGIRRTVKKIEIFRFAANARRSRTQVVSVLNLIQAVHRIYPELEIVNLGESDFVIRYEPYPENKAAQYLKVALICVILFFGGAFTIMTFIEDVSVGKVFDRFYERVAGVPSTGISPLEVSFCIGLAAGIMIFYNHVGRKKITDDPTPIQAAMRKYEQDVDGAQIETAGRKGTNIDVDD